MTDSQPTTTRPATISDVAREAGTGKTSVSRYLNGETHVLSTDLRQRIEAAIARLNYRPNQMAREPSAAATACSACSRPT